MKNLKHFKFNASRFFTKIQRKKMFPFSNLVISVLNLILTKQYNSNFGKSNYFKLFIGEIKTSISDTIYY